MNRARFFRFHAPEPGDAGGGGGAGTPPPAPPAGGAAPPPPPPPAPPGLAWMPGADADTVGYVQNKGWSSPTDVLAGYRNLETMLGADRAGRTVVLPADDDPVAWGKVFDRMGRPANPADYKLPVPEGGDASFAAAAAAKFHELGLPTAQAQKLTAWFNEQVGASTKQQTEALAAQHAAEDAQLTKDWGDQRVARTEIARRGMQQLGLDPKAVDALQQVVGFSGVMKALAKVGEMAGEHGAEGSGMPGSFSTTPEGAKARRAQLMADPDFAKKAMDPNSAQWAELKRLDAVLAGSRV